MGDPVFDHGLNLAVWIILLIKVVAVFAIVMVSVLFMVMYERKAVAQLGVRYGPNRAGPNGWLQSLADGTKLLFKEAFAPRGADKFVYRAAPYLMLFPALLVFAIVPIGGTITVAGHTTRLQLADPPWGILFLLMMSGISVYGVMLAGWASGSKYPLLGSVRASAQLVSYEAVLGLTVATVVLVTGSLRTSAIVASQHGGFLNHWNFLRTLLIPSALFIIAITAEMTRPPFDLVEAELRKNCPAVAVLEVRLVDRPSPGFTWPSTPPWSPTPAYIIVTLWFGGPDGPRIAGNSIGPVWFAIKVLILLFLYVWVRATLPRLRYDQLMDLGWKRLIPAALAMLMIVAGRQISYAWGLVAFGAARTVLGAGLPACRSPPAGPPPRVEAALRAAPRRGEKQVSFLDFFKGFFVTGQAAVQTQGHHAVPGGEGPRAGALSRPARPSTATRTAWRKCIGCELCAGVCPARCASAWAAADNPPGAPVSLKRAGTASSTKRSTSCAASTATCAWEACPTEAITESKKLF